MGHLRAVPERSAVQRHRRVEPHRAADLHRLRKAPLPVPLWPAHFKDSPHAQKRKQPERFASASQGRLLVVLPGYRGYFRHSLHRRATVRLGRPLPGCLHSPAVPADCTRRGRLQDHRREEHGRLQVAGRNLLPAVHHAFPADLHADKLGGGAHRRTAVAAYRRGGRSVLPVNRPRLGTAESL